MTTWARAFGTVIMLGIGVATMAAFWGPAFGQAARDAVPVEPDQLERRTDLIGHEVIVDDHVKYYVLRNGAEPDELQLKRTGITFAVPRRLRPPSAGRISSVVVHGVLRREGGALICDVTDLRAVAADLERLERGIKSLPANDFETRRAWVRWAERRAREFKDSALLARAKTLEGEALRIESDVKRLGVDAPTEWLALAEDARRRHVAEPEPSALGHRALRAKLDAATTAGDLKALIQQIEAFFPAAATDKDAARTNLAGHLERYNATPADAYRDASEPIRRALDRRLWADATARLFEREAANDFQAAISLADQTPTTLPEKPALASQLLDAATRIARQDLGTLRLSEVKALAAAYREKLQQPDRALELLRDWLKVQRDRLSSTDAEGPVELGTLYEELLQDRATAVELLRIAWKIDPTSKETAEAFRTRGYKKVKNEWVEAIAPTPAPATAAASLPARPAGLRGLTAEEVRARLGGKPDRVSYSASKGQMIEQWIYHLDTKQVRFVNLLHAEGVLKPTVIADYTVPSSFPKGQSRPTP